jgi:hypothetical protein
MLMRLLYKILRITPYDERGYQPVQPEDIPWDVPLDQTKPPMHRTGDTPSV